MPVINKFLYLSIYLACSLVLRHDILCGNGVLLTEDENKLLGLTCCQCEIRLERTAGIGVVVEHVIALAALNSDGVAIISVSADKAVEIAVISTYVSAHQTEESLSVVGTVSVLAAVLVYVLYYLIALKRGACDEQGVLEIYLILLVVVLVGELDKAPSGKVPCLIALVCYLDSPYLIGLVQGHIVSQLALDAAVL